MQKMEQNFPQSYTKKTHLADSPSFIKLHTEFSLEINLNVTSDFRSKKISASLDRKWLLINTVGILPSKM
jgi:hypothetical protein